MFQSEKVQFVGSLTGIQVEYEEKLKNLEEENEKLRSSLAKIAEEEKRKAEEQSQQKKCGCTVS